MSNLKDNEFVSSYFSNAKDRVFYRYLFTSFYTPVLNLILNRNFRYFNGLTFYNTKEKTDLTVCFSQN